MFDALSDNDIVSGINLSEFNKTVLEIDEIAENLRKLFSQAEVLMLNAKDCYSSESADKLFESFDAFKTNFDVAVANVKTYESDLIKVRENFTNVDLNSGGRLKNIGKEGK